MAMLDHAVLGRVLFDSLQSGEAIAPLTRRYPELTIDDAYRISLAFLNIRKFENGEKGLASNLEESTVGVVVLGKGEGLREGTSCKRLGKLLETPDAYEIVTASSLQKEALEAFELPMALSPMFN